MQKHKYSIISDANRGNLAAQAIDRIDIRASAAFGPDAPKEELEKYQDENLKQNLAINDEGEADST